MANSDASITTLRYNTISTNLEYAEGINWFAVPGAGVTTLNGLSRAVVLAAGSNITLTPSGNTITIASTGGGGGGTPNYAVATDSISYNVTSTSFQATGFQVTITPSSVSAAIFLTVTSTMIVTAPNDAGYTTIYRGVSTNLAGAGLPFVQSNSLGTNPLGMTFIDVPGTTSPVVYTVYIKSDLGSGSSTFNSGVVGVFTAQEIH